MNMENKPNLSVRELTEIIHNCQSSLEIERLVSDIQPGFDSYPLSDQAFLLAIIGVTLMTATTKADPVNRHIGQLHLTRLLSTINWRENDSLN